MRPPSSLLPALVTLALTGSAAAQARAAPVVAGAARAGLDARLRGEVLLAELACTACHGADEVAAPRTGPDLAAVAARVDAAWLERWLEDPNAVKPGTTMPDLLRGRAAAARRADAAALAHYLRSLGGEPAAGGEPDAAAARRGGELFHTVGCVACHDPRDRAGRETPLGGGVPLGDLGAKYAAAGLQAFLLEPLRVRPAGRMPDFALSPQEAHDLAQFLAPAAPPRSPEDRGDAALAARGRALFAELRCARCHDGTGTRAAPARPLAGLDPARGCLADDPGPAPHYDLASGQRADLRAALAARVRPLTAAQRLDVLLAAHDCLACHERGERGGPSPERAELFGTVDPALGIAGRMPPPLTEAGAKLQSDWLERAIAHGQRERPYLHARMPGFGADAARRIAEPLAAVDAAALPAIAALPEDGEQAKAVRELGRELTGDRGMACTTCHAFAGRRAGAMAAVDLVATTGSRLRPEWFRRYLLDPTGYRALTIMPQFFAAGGSARPDLAGGDVERQIAALWHYLAEGRNVRQPSGLRDEPIELTVGDEAVLLRRAVQNTGKRGIAVGYPGGVSLTFDAESLAINQVWWGRFLDVAPVFHGQGSGQARIPSRERAALGAGPAFAVLADLAAPWPAVSRRELGMRLLGYDLDGARRPAFRYTFGGVTIRDFARELPGDPRPPLRRTLSLAGEAPAGLWFRALHGVPIEDRGGGVYGAGGLRIAVPAERARLRGTAGGDELLLRIGGPPGDAELVIEYRWEEEGR